MRAKLSAFFKDETATSAIEYGLFSALIAVAIAGTVSIGARLTTGS